jgi:adenylate kinase family enzyme
MSTDEGEESVASLSRVHVIGVPGSGKTTTAQLLGSRLGAPVYDLDFVYYERGTGHERATELVLADLEAIVAQPAWITEGSFVDRIDHVLASAELIVWLDVRRPIVVWRLLKRHVVASARGTNQHRGIRKLIRFVRFVAGRYDESRMEKERAVARYQAKVRRVTLGRPDRIVELVAGPARTPAA